MAAPPLTRKAPDYATLRARLARAQSETGELSPQQALELLERRARALARKPEPPRPGERLELLCFGLAGERYAIASRYVLQVAALQDLTRVPGAPPQLLGVTNLRGQVLPVFDLRVLLGVSRAVLSDRSRLLVLGEGEVELGMLADSADDVIAVDPGELLEPALPLAGLSRACVLGVTAGALVVLDGAALLSDRRLFLDDVPDERTQA